MTSTDTKSGDLLPESQVTDQATKAVKGTSADDAHTSEVARITADYNRQLEMAQADRLRQDEPGNGEDSDIAAQKQRGKRVSKPRKTERRTPTEVAEMEGNLPLQLNFWPNEVRGVPNAALRGSLFSISKEREMAKKRVRLETVEGYKIMFKGERFNQRDLDLWEMLLHIGRQQNYGKHIEFVASELLKALGRTTGGCDYEELKEDMSRLMSGVVEITFTDTNETFIGSLIHNAYREENTQRYAVVFDEKMRKLYDAGYTHVDWEQRTKIKDNSLAKWLHGFYATHAAPLPYKVETLFRLCGSTTNRLTDFRKALRVAMEKLKDVGAITSWSIDADTDLVRVQRAASASQRRHLTRKQTVRGDAEFSGSATEMPQIAGFDSQED